MKNVCFFISLVLAVLLSACTSENGSSPTRKPQKGKETSPPPLNESTLTRSWCIVDTAAMPDFQKRMKSKDFQDYRSALKYGISTHNIWYHFFNDGTASEIWLGIYRTGQWKYNAQDSTITTNFADGTTTIQFRILDFKGDVMTVDMKDSDLGMPVRLKSPYKTLGNATEDPYHPKNNTWRKRPSKLENDAALRARLKSHLQHYMKIFAAGIQDDRKQLSYKQSPSCLVVYSSGFSLRKKKDLPLEWFETFYNHQQAGEAYDILKKVMSKRYSLGDTSGDWRQDNIDILQYLHDQL